LQLLVQPDDAIAPILNAIKSATKSIALTIFRFDRKELEKALEAAVARGVSVHALIAHTNAAGEKPLRKLELNLLAAGVTVSRTADDLVRYHNKMIIVDESVLYVLGYNFTRLDMEGSRSFGIITKNRKLIQEALKLFTADSMRQPYVAGYDSFVVSPDNARRTLSAFIKKAQKELLIYDPKLSDPAMIRLLLERAKAGVDVRILGRLAKKGAVLKAQKLPKRRLHVRAIVRDGRRAFIGSQSLRKLELDSRREVGVIIREPKIVKQICGVFEEDWSQTDLASEAAKAAKAAAKAESKDESKAEAAAAMK
jgi:phosphatidylserine/phosphatidylglycerophosphate/cardiolipin synthase-like enzyme